MSAKKAKEKVKVTGYDIGCRIVMALAAISVPIVAYFANLIYVVYESSAFKILSQLLGDSQDDGSTCDYLSINRFINEFLPLINKTEENKTSVTTLLENLSVIKVPFIVTTVFFALAILIAIAVVISAIVSNNTKIHFGISVGGLVSTIAMYISFHYVSTPILNGTISLGDFFESALMKTILPLVAKISVLNLSSAWMIMLMIFIGLVVLSGANLIINAGEKSKANK